MPSSTTITQRYVTPADIDKYLFAVRCKIAGNKKLFSVLQNDFLLPSFQDKIYFINHKFYIINLMLHAHKLVCCFFSFLS